MSDIIRVPIDVMKLTPTPDGMLDAFLTYYNSKVADYDVPKMKKEDAYVVWFCYIVGNAKALISTTRHDHMYYELTYHENKGQLYIDSYLKVSHNSYTIS